MCRLLHPWKREGLAQHRLISNKPTASRDWETSSWEHMMCNRFTKDSVSQFSFGRLMFLPFPFLLFRYIFGVFFSFFSPFPLSFLSNIKKCRLLLWMIWPAVLRLAFYSGQITRARPKNNGMNQRHELWQQMYASSLVHYISR